jgi:PAS domain S-box-containing protein
MAKVSDKKKRDSDERLRTYRQIFDEAQDGIVLVDLDSGLVADCNPEFERQVGKPLAELRSLTIRNLAARDKRDNCNALVRDVKKRGEGSASTALVAPAGRHVDVDVRARKVVIQGKRYMQALVRDVTQQRSAENALRNSELKYRSLFNEARDGIVLVDEDGFIVDCNSEFERQAGRSVEALRTMKTWELRPPEDRTEARKLFEKKLSAGSIDPLEQRLQRPNGDILAVELSSRALRLDGVRYFQGITRDMTARKRAEKAIHDREERLRLVVEQTPAILWTVDRNMTFTSSEGSGLEVLGLKPGETVGRTLQEFFDTDDPNYLPIAVHRQALMGDSASYETEWQGRVFESHTEPLRDEAGQIIGAIGVATDITERKQAEDQLKESQRKLRALAFKMQEMREEQSRTIAREIHDTLGQMLTTLKMDVRWIQRRIREMEHQSKACDVITERLDTMSVDIDQTVKAVRDISTRLRPAVLDDLGLAGAIEWQTRDFEQRTGVDCYFRAEPPDDEPGSEQSTAIFRIFQEILTNVARHAEARRVDVKLTRDNGYVVLDVKDDGKGMRDVQARAMGKLGLLGMRERAQGCGGDLAVNAGEGKGTRVTVRIPVAKPAGEGHESTHSR